MNSCRFMPRQRTNLALFAQSPMTSPIMAEVTKSFSPVGTREPVGTINDYPMVGSITSKMREARKSGVPNYVALTDAGGDNVDLYAFGSAYLGSATHPFFVSGDLTNLSIKVKNLSLDPQIEGRLDDRMRLLEGFDRVRRGIDSRGVMHTMDEFNRRA